MKEGKQYADLQYTILCYQFTCRACEKPFEWAVNMDDMTAIEPADDEPIDCPKCEALVHVRFAPPPASEESP